MNLKFGFLLLLAGFVISCNPTEDCETDGLTYSSDIASIINSTCATSGCHASGTTTTFPMSNYAETSAAVAFGRIVGSINHSEGFSEMPKGGDKLDDCTISEITQWIADGAPE